MTEQGFRGYGKAPRTSTSCRRIQAKAVEPAWSRTVVPPPPSLAPKGGGFGIEGRGQLNRGGGWDIRILGIRGMIELWCPDRQGQKWWDNPNTVGRG